MASHKFLDWITHLKPALDLEHFLKDQERLEQFCFKPITNTKQNLQWAVALSIKTV